MNERLPGARPRVESRRSLVVCALAALLLAGCGSYRPAPVPYPSPPSTARDWATILHRPGKVSLETLETGRIRVMRSDILDLDDPKTAGLKDEELYVPVFAHLLRHDERGDFLVDSGLDRSFQVSTSGDMRGLFAYKVHAVQLPGEDVVAQLALRHVALKGVFFTHMHPDHLSGAASLPRDLRYIVARGEPVKSVGFLFYEDALEGARDFEEIDFSSAPPMPPVGPAVDLFGDGSAWALSTPGHTVGHLSYLVVTKTGPVLLTGDVSHTRWGFEHDVAPGHFNDGTPEDAHRSLEQLREFARLYPDVKIVFGHDR